MTVGRVGAGALLAMGCQGILGINEGSPRGNVDGGGSGGAECTGGACDGGSGRAGASAGGSSGAGGGSAGAGSPGAGGAAGADAATGSGGAAGSGGAVGTDAATGTDATPPACDGVTHECVEVAPASWTGPIAIFYGSSSTSTPACTGTFPTDVKTMSAEIDEGAPSCSCKCNTPAGALCSGVNLRAANGTGSLANCPITAPPPPAFTLPSGVCTAQTFTGQYTADAAWTAGTCTPALTSSIPTPTWTKKLVACGGGEVSAGACTDSSAGSARECLAKVPTSFSAICVYQGGDVPCPAAGEYSVKHVAYASFDDQRSCSTCTCGSGRCGGSVNFIDSCGAMPFPTLIAGATINGGCRSGATDTSGGATANATGSCPPSGGTLGGSVVKNGAITFCCRP